MVSNPKTPPPQDCPCGSGQRYAACCGRWHGTEGHLQAPTPEALMRSRYSAFVLGLGEYLRDTWHPRTRPTEPLVMDPSQRWLRLEVKQAPPAAGDSGTVTFVAVSKMGGRAHRLHECSLFVREGGRWYYLEGDILP